MDPDELAQFEPPQLIQLRWLKLSQLINVKVFMTFCFTEVSLTVVSSRHSKMPEFLLTLLEGSVWGPL